MLLIMETPKGYPGAGMKCSVLIAAIFLQGCVSAPSTETPPPAVPAITASASDDPSLPFKLTHRDGIKILFARDNERDTARAILEHAVRVAAKLGEFAGDPVPPFTIKLSDRVRTPIASRGVMNLPTDRIEQFDPEWAYDPFSIGHEMVHLIARGSRPSRLLAEGLAVYLNDKIAPPTYPNDGRDLDGLLQALEAQTGRIIPLLDSEEVRGGRETSDLRRQAYVQEGSFVKWLIETRGFDAFIPLLLDRREFADDDTDWAALEREWRAHLR